MGKICPHIKTNGWKNKVAGAVANLMRISQYNKVGRVAQLPSDTTD